jgi:gamma-glutamyltranspeptidase/glutathione hydrolase
VYQDKSLSQSIAHSRWLLGRTWGDNSNNLKIEEDTHSDVIDSLISKGHELVTVEPCNELMGHAGAVLLRPDQTVVAATDPRSDGKALVSLI